MSRNRLVAGYLGGTVVGAATLQITQPYRHPARNVLGGATWPIAVPVVGVVASFYCLGAVREATSDMVFGILEMGSKPFTRKSGPYDHPMYAHPFDHDGDD